MLIYTRFNGTVAILAQVNLRKNMDNSSKSIAEAWYLCAMLHKVIEAWIYTLYATQDPSGQMVVNSQITRYQNMYMTHATAAILHILNTKVKARLPLIIAAKIRVEELTRRYRIIKPYLHIFGKIIINLVDIDTELIHLHKMSTTWQETELVLCPTCRIFYKKREALQCITCCQHKA